SIDNGVHVNAGVAVLTDGVIVDTAATPAGGFGIGLLVLEGGTADVTRLYVARSLDQGVGVWNDPSRLTASHLVVRDTRCNPAGFCGGSLSALGAAQVMVDHAKLEAAPSYGIRAYGGARLTASRTLVTGRPGVTAVGLRVGLEGDATLSFARIEGWTGAAVTTEPESAEDTGGAMAHLEDVVVAPGGADIADLAVALRSVAAGTIDGTNVVLAGSTGTAAEARGAGSSVRLTGAIVADTASSRTPSRAALQASEGGAVDVVSAEVLRSAGTAVSATDGSSLALSAVRASDSAGPAVVVAGAGSLAMLGSVAIVGHELAAVLVDAALLDAMDLRIDAPARVARRTDGLVAIGGAIVRVDRIEVSGARGVGVGAWGSSTSLTLSNARISGTAMEGGVAASLGLYEDPTFDVSRFACDDAAPATGLQLLPTPSRALGVGWVRDHAVGVAASTTTGLDVVVGEVVLLDVRAAIEAPSARDAPAAPVLE
ncbi:MAG: hypothetical protein IT379_20085, partial [Deltaproteobacteria bacterium]|nr:hypothetical protein [Deltaproteobacteria bacterium]